MKISLIAVGQRMPAWVNEAYEDFAKRMPRECAIRLIEIPAAKRTKNTGITHAQKEEAERSLEAAPKGALLVALDTRGKELSTEQLSVQLADWLQGGRDIALIIGGPDGLADAVMKRADMKWSLSKLTLPHAMVRVVVAEQIYRAWSMLKNHPYHR